MKKKFVVYASNQASQERVTASSEYQVLMIEPDGYDLAYGEGPVHDIEYWEDATLEDLRRYHQEDLNHEPGVNPDFQGWLQEAIKDGYIRKSVQAAKTTSKRKVVASEVWDMPEYDHMVSMYMPSQGEGDTMASQCATAINKLVFRWYNDGDVFDNHYGLEGFANDLSSFANWLYKYIPKSKGALDQIFDCVTNEQYERLLSYLVRYCCDDEDLEQLDKQPKQGSIYRCDGPFSYDENLYGDDDDDY